MIREHSHITGSKAAPTMSNHARNGSPMNFAAAALTAAVAATRAISNSASLAFRLTGRSGAARRAQVEPLQTSVQGLPREPKALRCSADVTSRLSQARLQHFLAEMLGLARRRARCGREDP